MIVKHIPGQNTSIHTHRTDTRSLTHLHPEPEPHTENQHSHSGTHTLTHAHSTGRDVNLAAISTQKIPGTGPHDPHATKSAENGESLRTGRATGAAFDVVTYADARGDADADAAPATKPISPHPRERLRGDVRQRGCR